MSSQRRTRATNKSKHPGEVQIQADLEAALEDPHAATVKKRCSAAEVRAAEQAQQAELKAAEEARTAAIKKVAEIQYRMKQLDDSDMGPPATLPPKFRTKRVVATGNTSPQLNGESVIQHYSTDHTVTCRPCIYSFNGV